MGRNVDYRFREEKVCDWQKKTELKNKMVFERIERVTMGLPIKYGRYTTRPWFQW